jgi:hypothetical protein
MIIEELSTYQDASVGDGKRMPTKKEDVKALIGRSPDHCFVAGTKVLTDKGQKNIEEVRVGDNVITPFGIRKVLQSGMTHKDVMVDKIVFSNGNCLLATPGHKIYVNNKIQSVDTLSIGDKIEVSNLFNLILWRIRNISNMAVENIGFRPLVDITMQTSTTAQAVLAGKRKRFIAKYGKITMVKRYLQALLFTMLMEIPITTILIILQSLHSVSTVLSIGRKNGAVKSSGVDRRQIWIKQEKKHRSGTKAMQDENGIPRIARILGVKERRRTAFARSVVQLIRHIGRLGRGHVVVDVIKDYARENVYNIKVEYDNIYYANGILVSNSDTWIMRMYFEIRNKLKPEHTEEETYAVEVQRAKMMQRMQEMRETNSLR